MTDLEVDYLIKGAGATSMAFADVILSETNATMAIVDRYHRPGGHWNHAYPFVRLHQPSRAYGIPSRMLGSGEKDEAGPNEGFYELASGQEVLSHFDLAMNERFLPSGRVHYFPMSDLADDGTVTRLLSGEQVTVRGRKLVDGTHSKMEIPSLKKPAYEVSPEVTCVPLNDLPRITRPYAGYVIIGAGKTAMDACIWLLENGADPESIRWVMPRDFWLLNRDTFQPGSEFFELAVKSIADQAEALANAASLDELLLDLESRGNIFRIDPAVMPRGYHCATVSKAELERLRSIRNIVRMGHVTRIEPDKVVLEQGSIPSGPDVLHVDCSARGIPRLPSKPIFEGDRITLQFVRFCQPTFSAAMIGHVEATVEGEAEKNSLCPPQAIPDTPRDYVEVMRTEFKTRMTWAQHPELGAWMAKCRLDIYQAQFTTMGQECPEAIPHFQRYMANMGKALENAKALLAN